MSAKKKLSPEEKEERMRPIVAKRVANRDIRDGYDDPVIKEKGRLPNVEEKYAIKRLLNMHRTAKFPKCTGRDFHKAEGLDRKDGFTLEQIRNKEGFHTLDNHVCPECRCRRTAGAHTRGYWYWTRDNREGNGEVGHFGLGPCYFHSPLYSLRMGGIQVERYRENINRRIEAMQEMGLAPDRQGGALVALRDAAEVSEVRMATKAGYQGIFQLTDEVLTELRRHRSTKASIGKMVGELCEVFGVTADMMDHADLEKISEIFLRKPLTEMSRGVQVSMSDKTAIELEEKLLKSVVQAGKTVFEVHEDDYVDRDEVVRLFNRFFGQAEASFKAVAGEEEWLNFIASTKDITRTLADQTFKEGDVR